MEPLVVTLETATALKAASFPQDGYVWWTKSSAGWLANSTHCGYSDYYAAPTAQEIADELSTNPLTRNLYIEIGRVKPDKPLYWTAGYNHLMEPIPGSTMAEALAALWLLLHHDPNQNTNQPELDQSSEQSGVTVDE